MGLGGQSHAPAALHLGKRTVTYFTGGRVGPMVSVARCGETPQRRDSIREPSRP